MYNPFVKGTHPVGVRTIELSGTDNRYLAEVWYPASAEYRGIDALDTFKYVDELPPATQQAFRNAQPESGKRPLVMYWHGGYGHRREMAAMCVFLASHGFVVAAADFPGDHVTHTFGDDPLVARQSVDGSAVARPAQAAEIIDLLTSTSDDFLNSVIDPSQVGSFGMSLGGFTSLAVNSHTARSKSCVAICPMTGSRSTVAGVRRLSHLLRTDNWVGAVSTFVLSGSEDCFVIADDVRDLFEKIAEPKRLAVLKGAGHIHWADNAELIHETMRARYASGEFPDPEINGPQLAELMRPFSELCPAEHATDTLHAITVAHFEAELKGNFDARSFLDDDLARSFGKRGIDLEVGGSLAAAAGEGR